MNMHISKLALAAGVSLALLAGCGGDSSGNSASNDSGVIQPPADLPQNISSVYAYVLALIGQTSETSLPVEINSLTLATDETSPPTAFE